MALIGSAAPYSAVISSCEQGAMLMLVFSVEQHRLVESMPLLPKAFGLCCQGCGLISYIEACARIFQGQLRVDVSCGSFFQCITLATHLAKRGLEVGRAGAQLCPCKIGSMLGCDAVQIWTASKGSISESVTYGVTPGRTKNCDTNGVMINVSTKLPTNKYGS